MLHTSPAGRAIPAPRPERSTIDRMADDLQELEGSLYGAALQDEMKRRGWSELDLTMYGAAAGKVVLARSVRDDTPPSYDRAARIGEAARLIGHLVPTRQVICAALQTRNFPKPELDEILEEAIAKAADDFAHRAGAQ